MADKKKIPEFEIIDDVTPTTSDGECICTSKDGRNISCILHGG